VFADPSHLFGSCYLCPLQVLDRPQWRTVSKRSRQYLQRIVAALDPATTTIRLNTSVTAVRRQADASSPSGYRISVTTETKTPTSGSGSTTTTTTTRTEVFDYVLFGSHPDEALAMLGRDASAEEKRVLGNFRYQPNTSYLHTDEKLMPVNKACWSAWNFIGKGKAVDSEEEPCCVSYWLNLLQNLPPSLPQMFITLNPSPDSIPAPEKTIRTFSFAHPQYTQQSVAAQEDLQRVLQGLNGCYYAGAYLGYGFHEDAVTSGIRAAHRLTKGQARPSWWDKPLYTIPTVLKPAAITTGSSGSLASASAESELEELLLKRAAGGPYWTDNLGNGGAVGRATALVKQVMVERAKLAAAKGESANPSLGANQTGDIAGRVVCYPADVLWAFKTLIAGTEEAGSNATASSSINGDSASDKSGTETNSEEEERGSISPHHHLKASPTNTTVTSGRGAAGRGESIFGNFSESDLSLAMAAASAPAASAPSNASVAKQQQRKVAPGGITTASASRRQRLIKAFSIMLEKDTKDTAKARSIEKEQYKNELGMIEQVLGYKRTFKNDAVRKLFWPTTGTGGSKFSGAALGQLMEKGSGGYTVQEEPLHRPDVYPSFLSYAWHTLKGAALSTAASPIMGFLDRAIKKGAILFRTPDGTERIFGDPSALPPFRARLRVHSWKFFVRVASEADIGLARSFIHGEWTTDDLTSLFRVFVANRDDSSLSAGSLWMSKLGQTLNYLSFTLGMDNDLAGARKNISAHYDLSNDMFTSFLDGGSTMMYSCAFFDTERRWVREQNVVGTLPCKNDAALPTVSGSEPTTARADALDLLAMQVSAVPLPVPTPPGLANHDGTQLRQELVFKGSLVDAQTRKLDHLIARANVQKGDRVLDLGAGWQGLSIRLAETVGCKVVGITLSKEQYDLANERVKARGLEHLVSYEIIDYREFAAKNKGAFDRIISVEMIEAVGHKHFPEFMRALDDLLAPNGVVVIQAITIPETRWEEYITSSDFINTLIFPGGCCVSLTALLDANRRAKSSLVLQSTEDFSLHYAETLRRWRANFALALDDVVRPQGKFDDEFARTWQYYFQYCEAGFQSQTLGLHVLTFARPGTTNLWSGESHGKLASPYGPVINTPGDDAIVVPSGVF
jgi:cyclopropane-fatty-acyl-phospholipid synthase